MLWKQKNTDTLIEWKDLSKFSVNLEIDMLQADIAQWIGKGNYDE
jgi:hypothetical protein